MTSWAHCDDIICGAQLDIGALDDIIGALDDIICGAQLDMGALDDIIGALDDIICCGAQLDMGIP